MFVMALGFGRCADSEGNPRYLRARDLAPDDSPSAAPSFVVLCPTFLARLGGLRAEVRTASLAVSACANEDGRRLACSAAMRSTTSPAACELSCGTAI